MRKVIGVIALLGIGLVGCAPTALYDVREGSKVWTMTVDGHLIRPDTAGTFTYKTPEYEMTLTLYRTIIAFTLVNLSDKVLRLSWDESAMVLSDGRSSRVVNGGTTWGDRNAPKPPSIVPPKAKISDAFYPLATAYFSNGWNFEPLFDYPVSKETNIRISVALTVGDQPQRKDFLFTAKP